MYCAEGHAHLPPAECAVLEDLRARSEAVRLSHVNKCSCFAYTAYLYS